MYDFQLLKSDLQNGDLVQSLPYVAYHRNQGTGESKQHDNRAIGERAFNWTKIVNGRIIAKLSKLRPVSSGRLENKVIQKILDIDLGCEWQIDPRHRSLRRESIEHVWQ